MAPERRPSITASSAYSSPERSRDRTPSPTTRKTRLRDLSPDPGDDDDEDIDLKAYIRSLPTKKDMEKYVARMEESNKQAIHKMQKDLHQIGNRMQDTEQAVETLSDRLDAQQTALHEHSAL